MSFRKTGDAVPTGKPFPAPKSGEKKEEKKQPKKK